MKEHTVTASEFNKQQRVNEVWKKAVEQEEMMRPPPAVAEEAIRRKQKYLSH
jgi:hypothetical protein